jgi:predicted transcriptional regulator
MTTEAVSSAPVRYLDRAMTQLRDLGLVPDKKHEAPIIDLLNRITDLDEERVVAIARTLNQASLFNEVVREQLTSMTIGERYEDITASFDSIRKDAKGMVDQLEDGKIDTWERLGNVWMKVSRGDISDRFEKIKKAYLDVAEDSKAQIQRERIIMNAYQDYRGALKQAEVQALELLDTAEAKVEQAKATLDQAVAELEAYSGDDPAERARLELARDERLRAVQDADDRYQITKDISDNLTTGYHTSEVIMARLQQTTSAKERVYKQAVAFFGTNETVLTALSASFTGMLGLHESTKTLDAMKEGVSDSLEDLAEIGGKVQEEALKAGYGPTIRAESVKKLVQSVADYQERSHDIIEEMRTLSTRNAEEIRDAVEEGKKRMAKLEQRVKAMPDRNDRPAA